MTEPTVNVLFTWQTFMPDHRQFKQNSIVLTPQDTIIMVQVPLKYEYVSNAERILVDSLYSTAPRPILTPLGMRYVMDQLESVLPDAPIKSGDFNPDTEEDEFETVTDDEDDEWK